MKTFNKGITLALFLLLSCSAYADNRPSCQDLDEIAGILDQVAEAFEQTGEIREGGEIDNALGDLVDGLLAIAKIENDRRLSRNVNAMADGWEGMDGDQFASSLDGVIGNLDSLYRRDCE